MTVTRSQKCGLIIRGLTIRKSHHKVLFELINSDRHNVIEAVKALFSLLRRHSLGLGA